MDNARFGAGPSEEWRSYSVAHPELNIDADGKHDNGDPVTLRSAVNAGRDAGSRALFERDGLGSKITIDDHAVPTRDGSTITARVYRPANPDRIQSVPAYLFYHGGGFLFGTTDSESYACSNWALRLGFTVIHVCYRHTPEFVFPTQHHDAWDGFEWVVANAEMLMVDPANIVVGGISAGGSVTAAVVLQEVKLAKQEGRTVRIKGQLLAIPWLIHREAYPWHLFADREKASLVQCADAPILPKQRYDLFTDLLKVANPKDPLMNVGLSVEEDLTGMPKTAFIVSGYDMLRDDAFIYANTLERLQVPTKKHIFPGLPHAFRRWPDLPSSKRWDEVTLGSIQWCLDESAGCDDVGSWSVETTQQQ
ncbi:alpha/beta-hydrolase [Coniochaeta ligniaria NRRL 30616]|uniref:Alpha/beta-hydrolase n=1 Tax=Coniochaeta ligniaria NRRL 30616 TaxID=1408157 RepID=A0A1J7J6K8_9PEZI|nr:alpha/beta-hydrolase [Coniochaeta ligniaria NRRL 30616]